MLVCVLALALVGGRPGFSNGDQLGDVIPKKDCFVYHDRSAQIKLSDSRHGYPGSDIAEELVKRPYMRPVLFGPDPEHRTPYSGSRVRIVEIGKRLHKRSYGFYPTYRRVYPYYRAGEFNPALVHHVQRKPVHVVDPKPVHPIHPAPVHHAQHKSALVVDPKPVHPIHPAPVHHAQHKSALVVDPKPVHPIHPAPVHHAKPVLTVQPKPAHLVHPAPVHHAKRKPVHAVQPNTANAVHLTKPVHTSKPICQSRKYALRRFWLHGGNCYVINPDYQKVTYARCSRHHDCSNCTRPAYNVNHNTVNKCVETFETLDVWAFCDNLSKYDRIQRVGISLPKYCSCQTFTC
ncbi:uncharacterized protein LOC125374052 isoform X1 [Haliotis rufescens]|uniref:uncharacterized protein LOC125374052 isoform X1 n=1 Tax=Haliotis rufescens TaxID=6454 RepID=UPI00201F1910|nr:uncharacterized protein LOC125374052 isoform X1 [Haliotis rufescens]